MSLTMVFTEEDRVVIKFLHQNNGHNAKNLVKEFPLKIGKFDLVAVILNTCCDSDACCLCLLTATLNILCLPVK